jgi:hypothetical protein
MMRKNDTRGFSIISMMTLIALATAFIFSSDETITTHAGIGVSSISTAIPTASLEDDGDLKPISDALAARNRNCVLPCFWGFRPGETSFVELVAYLEETGFADIWKMQPDVSSLEQYLREHYPFGFRFLSDEGEKSGGFAISFGVHRNLLNSMEVQFYEPNTWLSEETAWIALPDVLGQMSSIPEIYIAGNSIRSDFVMLIVYREEQVQLVYSFDLSTEDDLDIRFCLGIEHTNEIIMELNITEEQGLVSNPPESSSDPHGLHPIEEYYQISAEPFVEFFRENPDDCLDVSEYNDE